MSESLVVVPQNSIQVDAMDNHHGFKSQAYRYTDTGMELHLEDTSLFKTTMTDPVTVFDESTLFHYCNLILDKYDSKILNLGLFQNENNYGPKKRKVDIYFHPFQWKDQWHLAIGFSKYSKILFVRCSDYVTTSSTEQYPSFSRKASIKIKEFIMFFKQKLSRNALTYPRLFTDLFEPATSNNAVNLLAIIFSFCLDPVSLLRSFCDPDFSPRKFEISDIYPILDTIDVEFRTHLESERETQLEEQRLKDEQKRQDILKKQTQLLELEKKREAERKEFELREVEKRKQEAREREVVEEREREREREREELMKRERGERIKEREEEEHRLKQKEREGLEHVYKKAKLEKGLAAAEEINDLESSDELEEEIPPVRLPSKIAPQVDLGKIARIENLFSPSYAEEFMANVYRAVELHDDLDLNKMFKFIESVCLNSLTNPEAFADEGKGDKFLRNGFKMRECLHASYKKGSKLEFDEDQFSRMLEQDYKNQIIPIVFINDSIFLVNIKTSDNFNCIVRIFCISNRTNRSEREVLRSYALRRLIEMYVFKHHKLVTKIKLCMVPVKNAELYKVLMQTIFIIHKVMWRNKFDTNLKFTMDELDNYTLFFENIMKNIKRKDVFQIELNWKRLIKHVLTKSD